MPRPTRARAVVTSLVLALALAACSPADPGDQAGRSATPDTLPTPSSESTGPSPSEEPMATPSDPTPEPPSADAGGESGESAAGQAGRGPTRAELRRARRIAARLPLAELAGQVIVAEYDGQRAPIDLVEDLHLGGVIVMGGNIGSTDGLRRSNRALQRAARKAGRAWPVFVGVDQEGGVVERVQGGATRFPSFMSTGAARDARLTRRAAAASGAELADLGFTVVFAPDGDVTSGTEDPTIGSRSAGSAPELVARQTNAAVDGYLSAGVVPVVKHFPGHGSVPADSHVELPVQDKPLGRLRATDLVPFRAAVAQGAPAVMVAHIDVRAVDPGQPSTLSEPVVTGLLRRDLGFPGLVVTDAMNMAAVADRFSSAEAAVLALAAGNDVVLMPPDPAAARDGIVAAVRGGRLDRARLEQAAARQIAVLLHQAAGRTRARGKPGTGAEASYRLSAAAVTVVSGPCRRRLVGGSVRATGPEEAVARFYAAAERAGLRTGRGTHVALIGYGGSAAAADVVVTLDTPYALGDSSARVARIALYGDTPGAMRALVDVLLGKARAPGKLPVPVPGVERTGC